MNKYRVLVTIYTSDEEEIWREHVDVEAWREGTAER